MIQLALTPEPVHERRIARLERSIDRHQAAGRDTIARMLTIVLHQEIAGRTPAGERRTQRGLRA